MHCRTTALAVTLLTLSVVLAEFAPLAAETLNCKPSQKFVCSLEGCKTAPAKVRAVIDMDKQTYSRCDSEGCDKYDAAMNIGGFYLNVSVPGKSALAKVEIPSLGYFETVTSGLTVSTSFGKCSRQ